jgi:hypothetical protein
MSDIGALANSVQQVADGISSITNGASLPSNTTGTMHDPDIEFDNNIEIESSKTFRFRTDEGIEPLINGYNYYFFTAPPVSLTNKGGSGDAVDSNIYRLREYGNLTGQPIDIMIKALGFLKGDPAGSDSGIFMHLLNNRARSFTASAQTMQTIDYSETWNRYKMILGSTIKDSRIGGNFSINFAEDQYLTIIHTIRLWMLYIEACYFGYILPRHAYDPNILKENAFELVANIDYYGSLYHFHTLPDGTTINYYAKYTGIIPTSIPFDIFTSNDGDHSMVKDVGIGFHFSYKEDLNPAILMDFDSLIKGTANGSTIKTDRSILTSGNAFGAGFASDSMFTTSVSAAGTLALPAFNWEALTTKGAVFDRMSLNNW